jgi:hypothetical protein
MMQIMSGMKRLGPRLGIALVMATSPGCLSIDTSDEGVAVLTVATGNNQTVEVSKAAAAPLVLRAFDNGAGPMEGVEIRWSVEPSSGGTVSSSTTTTDSAGFAQVNFTAGSAPGTVFVRASADGLTISFTITVVAASA